MKQAASMTRSARHHGNAIGGYLAQVAMGELDEAARDSLLEVWD